MPVRRVYRLVSNKPPTVSDFLSLIESGHPPYKDPALQRRAEEISVWDRLSAAVRVARRKRHLGYVAVLEVPETIDLTPGHHGHWGIPREVAPEEILRWIVGVIAVPSIVGDRE